MRNENQQEILRLGKGVPRSYTFHISKLQLGQDEMLFGDYMIMEGEDNVEAKYCMWELVDMALGQRIEPLSVDLNAKPLDSLDVDERPPPIVKLTKLMLSILFSC